MSTAIADARTTSGGVAAAPLGPLPDGWTSLGAMFARVSRRFANRTAGVDSTGASVTYRDLCRRAVALARVLGREVGPSRYVGLLLPPTVAGQVANLAVTLLGKVPVNLNYTASEAVVNAAIGQCGITHVLASRRLLEKAALAPAATILPIEEVPARVTWRDKLAAAASTIVPAGFLGRILPGFSAKALEEPATVIFTSGSTGEPKGVVLTHRNVLSNVQAVLHHIALRPEDNVLGILPFFHSFGFTVTIWTALGGGMKGVYHFNPLDAKIIGRLCEEHEVSIILATPTFVRGYLQRCKPEQFGTVRLLVLGAEKLKPELAREIKERIGIDALEGYGCTETGPVVAVNALGTVAGEGGVEVAANRPGTVGRPLPGTSLRTVDPTTGAVLPDGSEGLIEVKGPQVMAGYLNKPEATAAVLRDGWYATGDLGMVDADGFLKVTDRLNRFAKIGGEMVPHHAVESAIAAAAGVADGALAVTSIPDAKRGERLVVVHTGLGLSPEKVCDALLAQEHPRLWIPSAGDFIQVEALPTLGTGKLDLRAVRLLAQERAGAS